MKKIKTIIGTALLGTLLLTASGCENKTNLSSSFNKQSQTGEQAQIDRSIKDYATVKDDENNTDDEIVSNNIAPSHLNDAKDVMTDLNDTKDEDTIEINEKIFITQINDIYFNFEDYKDKTIIVEGMYSVFESAVSDATAPVVYRNGPGCCNNDGWAGFLLKYKGRLPKENDWIRVTGKPELENSKEGFVNLYLNVDSLEILKERGREDVLQ